VFEMAAKTVEVFTHDGSKFMVEVEDFDAAEINDAINDTGRSTIVIGDAIFHRTNVSKIVPIRETSTTSSKSKKA
jgi:hypothetical protein